MQALRTVLPLLAALFALTACVSRPSLHPPRGPWGSEVLQRIPARTFGVQTGLVQEVTYSGEPLGGKPTTVFAYLGRPDPARWGTRNLPGMILVHGGGGKAFKEWADHWAQRGYLALAMDLAGHGASGRLPDGGPEQGDDLKFRNFTEAEVREMWTYHAVSAVVLGHSLLRSLPEVDPSRTGLTGISWGGYLTCIVAGLDTRFKVAVPVYGCGFLGDNSHWTDKSLAAMSPASRALWLKEFDPGEYLGGVRCPILFLNGTSDFAYPLDSYQKSYRRVSEKYRHISVNIDLPHGHIWTFPEVDAFVDQYLRKGKRVATIGTTTVRAHRAESSVSSEVGLKEAKLCFTTDSGPWQKRAWKSVPARIEGSRVVAEIPDGRPLIGYLSVTDERGVRISGEHFGMTQ